MISMRRDIHYSELILQSVRSVLAYIQDVDEDAFIGMIF